FSVPPRIIARRADAAIGVIHVNNGHADRPAAATSDNRTYLADLDIRSKTQSGWTGSDPKRKVPYRRRCGRADTEGMRRDQTLALGLTLRFGRLGSICAAL